MVIDNKKLAIFIIALQIIFVFSVLLDNSNMTIPLLRQISGFIYLTFIIGFLLLIVVLKITNIELLDLFVYSIGLSFSFLMFLGFIINAFYPYLGITKPITEFPLLVTIFIITLVLSVMLIKINIKININLTQVNVNMVLIFILLPFLSIFGSYLLCYYNSNLMLLMLYGIVATVPVIFSLTNESRRENWFIIWMISLSLLFSVALAKKYIIGGDAQVEYYFANIVKNNGAWDPQISSTHNSLLRVVILHPIYSILLNISLADVFRIIHPLQYSFTPVVLYIAFKKLFNEKIAIYSVMFFMFMHVFFVKLSLNTRTGLAELFLALFILTLCNKNVNVKNRILIIIFVLSIIVTHYGSSYFFMFALITAFIIEKFMKMCEIKRDDSTKSSLTVAFYLLYVTTTYCWYIYTSNSKNFSLFVDFITNVITKISEFFSPELSYTAYAISRKWVFSVEVSKNLLIVSLIFALIGLIYIIFKDKSRNMQIDYLALSISVLCLLLSTILPTRGFAIGRGYHFCLCFLAPFVVIGFVKLSKVVLKIFKISVKDKSCIKAFSVFLFVFLIFNSGFISEILTRNSDYSPNVLISKPREKYIDDPQYISTLYRRYKTDYEHFAAEWLSQKIILLDRVNIYLDVTAEHVIYSMIGPKCSYVHVDNKTKVRKGYIFLRSYNLERNIAIYQMLPWKAKYLNEVYPLDTSNKIYTNGKSEIYYR